MNKLKERFEKACNDYVRELSKMWGTPMVDSYWIGDKVGGILDHEGFYPLSMMEIVYIVDNKITINEIEKWQDYNLDAIEFGFNKMTINAWHEKLPRVPKDVIAKLKKLKKELNDMCEDIKNNLKNNLHTA